MSQLAPEDIQTVEELENALITVCYYLDVNKQDELVERLKKNPDLRVHLLSIINELSDALMLSLIDEDGNSI